ncbi:MAG: oxygen-dependent coproporphyrinogen oxidase [Pseudomonadota bacterium]|nr:oxygen-dependent coproporphyrinogen oxidase [Pseudomonadota bacterium]MED5275030.1 oxygen-dependent coproporphyrinogen oxidase [Pseudomonadota bacterium]|tara:strand:- start:13974 stop:14870 length:897 start_codon:yes stop_codon:yes gene_type:complete
MTSSKELIKIENNFKDIQKKIINEFSKFSPKIKLTTTNWKYKTGGGGKSCKISDNKIFEQGAINFSSIKGKTLPASALGHKFQKNISGYNAIGVSVVIHPHNPFVPCSHLNVRYFSLKKKNGTNIWWFGGGYDLTPYFPYKNDNDLWHNNTKRMCDKYDKSYYKKFKQACDKYFFLQHRNEKRGIGGIFFDGLNKKDKDYYLNFINDTADTFLSSYSKIVKERSSKKFTECQKDFQLYRRGRYVEFNLVYDRGTLFGLQSGGRIDSILMSLPPKVSWNIKKTTKIKKFEKNLLDFIKK